VVNLNKDCAKQFINCFASCPIECKKILFELNDIFPMDESDVKCFYLYPNTEIKSRFEIKLRRSPVNKLWSVVMIENWKAIISTYKKNMTERLAIVYVLSILDQEGK
jgi:hypothetical protein